MIDALWHNFICAVATMATILLGAALVSVILAWVL
jgi:hypothetical protein